MTPTTLPRRTRRRQEDGIDPGLTPAFRRAIQRRRRGIAEEPGWLYAITPGGIAVKTHPERRKRPTYKLTEEPDGFITCECRDAQRHKGEPCKHALAVRAVYGDLATLAAGLPKREAVR